MKTIFLLSVFLTICIFSFAANAQQTIFNVPSSDILDKGKFYFEFDATFKPNDQSISGFGRFSSFVPRIVAGTGGNIEVGLNITGNIQPGSDSTTLVPAIKYRPYNKNGWAVVLGDNVIIPVRNRTYKIGNYAYAQVSRTFKSGTRITAGGYHFSKNVVAANASRGGGQFGFEQPINKYINFNADWYTGKHAAGYFTPGFAFRPHPKVTGYVGYSIGNANASKGNHFVYAAIGINLN